MRKGHPPPLAAQNIMSPTRMHEKHMIIIHDSLRQDATYTHAETASDSGCRARQEVAHAHARTTRERTCSKCIRRMRLAPNTAGERMSPTRMQDTRPVHKPSAIFTPQQSLFSRKNCPAVLTRWLPTRSSCAPGATLSCQTDSRVPI
jgi:hypothetical protein